MKNILLKTLVRLIKPWIKPVQNKRILIVSTTALGDTLWATPAIESLRKSFPDHKITVLTSSIGMEVLKDNPHIDSLLPLKNWTALFKMRFETVLLFHASQRFILPLCSLLGATRIVGTIGINKGLDSLLTHPLPQKYQHEITRRLEIIQTIGATITTEKLSFFQPTLKKTGGPIRIALHPGSKDPFKRWPLFAKLGNLLSAYEIIITGRENNETLASQIPGAILAPRKQSLHEFAKLLSQVDLLVSNDTGPVHLAAALNVPVVAIYASTDPFLCGPHKAEKALIASRPKACTPCIKRKCKIPFCFYQISPEVVKNLCLKSLSSSSTGTGKKIPLSV